MEFTEHTCPVCEKRFENGDDIVVCPECGAPHHRDCYEQLGHCFYEDRHAAGFSFENAGSDSTAQEDASLYVRCPNCQAENEKTAFYCNSCGFPLNAADRPDPEQQHQQQDRRPPNGMPFGFGAAGAQAFDPLAGLNSDEEIADNVKVGEAAKFVGKNTPYFLSVFHRIRKFRSGKFNFAAFLLTGPYFIYRKMYVPGIILSLMLIGITVGSSALVLSNNWMTQLEYNDILSLLHNGEFGADMLFVMLASAALNLLRIGMMIFSGLAANRLYYSHCTKEINRAKAEVGEGELNKELERRGGVNLPMAISIFAAYAVIYELCNIYLLIQL